MHFMLSWLCIYLNHNYNWRCGKTRLSAQISPLWKLCVFLREFSWIRRRALKDSRRFKNSRLMKFGNGQRCRWSSTTPPRCPDVSMSAGVSRASCCPAQGTCFLLRPSQLRHTVPRVTEYTQQTMADTLGAHNAETITHISSLYQPGRQSGDQTPASCLLAFRGKLWQLRSSGRACQIFLFFGSADVFKTSHPLWPVLVTSEDLWHRSHTQPGAGDVL